MIAIFLLVMDVLMRKGETFRQNRSKFNSVRSQVTYTFYLPKVNLSLEKRKITINKMTVFINAHVHALTIRGEGQLKHQGLPLIF